MIVKPSLKTRLGWFDRGADAFRRAMTPMFFRDQVPAETGSLYLCPLCVTTSSCCLFKREAVELLLLTAEHAPPKHAGGRAVALTCAECNHRAGSQLDSHAQIADRLSGGDIGAIVDRPVKITLRCGNHCKLQFGPEGVKMSCLHNSPS